MKNNEPINIAAFAALGASPFRKCQWPHGHPGEKEFHFCGKQTFGKYSYCQEHAARAYRRR